MGDMEHRGGWARLDGPVGRQYSVWTWTRARLSRLETFLCVFLLVKDGKRSECVASGVYYDPYCGG